jgi:Zn-dependent membrane protease YugP
LYSLDSSALLLLPAFLLALWAQYNVKSTFEKYSRIMTHKGSTAAEIASLLLNRAGLLNVSVQRVTGHLTDNYDPVNRKINLSDPVYGSSSIASLGIAAHECGHAIQHSLGYSPLILRNAIVPVANLSSAFAIPLFFIGFIFSAINLMNIGIILFAGVVIFHLITLPVEFNASTRALTILHDTGTLSPKELTYARAVLNAAAWTYIAAATMAAVHLLRLLMLRNRR